jgi:hypothetical protein
MSDSGLGEKWFWYETSKRDFNAVYSSVDTILLSGKTVNGGFIDRWTEAAVQFPANPFYKFAQPDFIIPIRSLPIRPPLKFRCLTFTHHHLIHSMRGTSPVRNIWLG